MRSPKHLAVVVATATVSLVALGTEPSYADVEVGGIAGVHVFSHTNELGVPDESDAPSESNSVLIGGRIGYYFNDYIGVEGEVGFIPSEVRSGLFGVGDLAYRAHLIVQFRASNPQHRVIPFVFAGGGAMTILYSGMPYILGAYCGSACTHDTDAEAYVGAGVKYRLAHGWGVRGDLYLLFPPSSGITSDNWFDKATLDGEVLLSIYKHFGHKAEMPRAPMDTDGDGIADAEDKCPLEPEDRDGFQDADGCPDLDNDNDGIPDSEDKCPNEPEDHDGFQDADGCPDPDNDGDGIPDAQDKCPNEPEDKDGFQDADGCPDPDNDGDGIPDAQDKCPNEPETVNGYEDADGCPDTVPTKLKQFTGTIQGINFALNSAELLQSSDKTLDKAIAVLKEFPDLHIEIRGHTDDQQMFKGGKFADNKSLSQARAERVKGYLVAGGIDASRLNAVGFGDEQPIEDPKGLTGNQLVAARAKNRRVEFVLVSSTPPPPSATPSPAP
jgi:outer membrane protein OmpA-like peptidoglycan-associated protein